MATNDKRVLSDVEHSTDSSPENTTKPTKVHKFQDVLTEGDTYHGTTVQGVFTLNSLQNIPDPNCCQTELADWDKPLVMIISGQVRDLYLQFLHKLSTENKHLTDQTTVLTDTPTNNLPGKDTHPSMETNETVTLETLSSDMKKFNIEAHKITQKLDDMKQKYTIAELTQDLQTDQNFENFKVIRKLLSGFLGATKTINRAFKEVSSGHDYICKTEIHLIPNKINKSVIEEEVENINKTVKQTNIKLMKESIHQGLQEINKLKAVLQGCHSELVIAKAWRCTKKSANYSNNQKHNRQYNTIQEEHTVTHPRYHQEESEVHSPAKQTHRRRQYQTGNEEIYPEYKSSHHQIQKQHHPHETMQDYSRPYTSRYRHQREELDLRPSDPVYTTHTQQQQQHPDRSGYYTQDRNEHYTDNTLPYTHRRDYYREPRYHTTYYNRQRQYQDEEYDPNKESRRDRGYFMRSYDEDFPPLQHKPRETLNVLRRP